jgi:hypothetical protein
MTESSARDTTTTKASDQLPEEGPAELVPDDVPDAPEGAAREAGRKLDRANHRDYRTGEPCADGSNPEMPPAFDPKVPR